MPRQLTALVLAWALLGSGVAVQGAFRSTPNPYPVIYSYNRFDLAATIRWGHPVYGYLAARRAAGFTVGHLVSNCNSGSSTDAMDATGGDFVAASLAGSLGTGGFTDDESNSYSAVYDGFVRLGWSVPGSVSATLVVTSNANTFPLTCASVFSGVKQTDTIDGTPVGTETGVTTCQTAALTPGQDGSVVVAVVSHNNSGGVATIDGGFTIGAGFGLSGDTGTHYGGSIARLIQTTAASAQPTWSNLAEGVSCALLVAKPAAAGGGGGANPAQINTPIRGGGRIR